MIMYLTSWTRLLITYTHDLCIVSAVIIRTFDKLGKNYLTIFICS